MICSAQLRSCGRLPPPGTPSTFPQPPQLRRRTNVLTMSLDDSVNDLPVRAPPPNRPDTRYEISPTRPPRYEIHPPTQIRDTPAQPPAKIPDTRSTHPPLDNELRESTIWSHLASRISHLASRISHLASRISHLASRISHPSPEPQAHARGAIMG